MKTRTLIIIGIINFALFAWVISYLKRVPLPCPEVSKSQTTIQIQPAEPAKPNPPDPIVANSPSRRSERSVLNVAREAKPQVVIPPPVAQLPETIKVRTLTTSELIREKHSRVGLPPFYYSGEQVEGFVVPAGFRAEVNPLPVVYKTMEPCNHNFWVPCLVLPPKSGNYLVLGKCLNGRLEVEADCSSQMAHDLK